MRKRPRSSVLARSNAPTERSTHPRTLMTTAGDLDLKIPKPRAGMFFPALLERCRRIDQALFAVVRDCCRFS